MLYKGLFIVILAFAATVVNIRPVYTAETIVEKLQKEGAAAKRAEEQQQRVREAEAKAKEAEAKAKEAEAKAREAEARAREKKAKGN